MEAGRFRFGREVESVQERSELLKRSGRRTQETISKSATERPDHSSEARSGESLCTLTLLERFAPASCQKQYSSSKQLIPLKFSL